MTRENVGHTRFGDETSRYVKTSAATQTRLAMTLIHLAEVVTMPIQPARLVLLAPVAISLPTILSHQAVLVVCQEMTSTTTALATLTPPLANTPTTPPSNVIPLVLPQQVMLTDLHYLLLQSQPSPLRVELWEQASTKHGGIS